jgi:hypothetical protein
MSVYILMSFDFPFVRLLLPLFIKLTFVLNNKSPRHITLEIQVLAWDSHNNVAGINR